MKFNLEKLQKIATPLPDEQQRQMEYQIENRDWLILSVKMSMKIRRIMAIEGINRSELARRMGVSPAHVTKLLSGQENITLKTIAKVESAIGKSLIDLSIEEYTI